MRTPFGRAGAVYDPLGGIVGAPWLPVVNVKKYGAKGDGSTDDSAAINNAIAALPTSGGIVYFPAGTYAIASTINIGDGTTASLSTRNGIYLLGAAAPQALVTSTFTGPVTLKWTGASAGTMVSVNGPIYGWGLKNFCLDGNSLAGKGILATSAVAGDIERILVTGVTQSTGINATSITVTAVATFSGNNTDSARNYWRDIAVRLDNPAASGAIGILLTGPSGASANTAFDTFENVYFSCAPTTSGKAIRAVYLQGCAGINFRNIAFAFNGSPAGLSLPLTLDYGINTAWPADCLFDHIDFGAANYTAVAANIGTPIASAGKNRVVGIGSTDSSGTPPASPGLANLAWGYTAANP